MLHSVCVIVESCTCFLAGGLFDGQAFGGFAGAALTGLKDAPVLDLMCSHFVLTLAAKQGGKFNVRRDLNGLLALAGRHLVWPAPAARACASFWAGAARTTSSGAATKQAGDARLSGAPWRLARPL
jgi:hypothetical protein